MESNAKLLNEVSFTSEEALALSDKVKENAKSQEETRKMAADVARGGSEADNVISNLAALMSGVAGEMGNKLREIYDKLQYKRMEAEDQEERRKKEAEIVEIAKPDLSNTSSEKDQLKPMQIAKAVVNEIAVTMEFLSKVAQQAFAADGSVISDLFKALVIKVGAEDLSEAQSRMDKMHLGLSKLLPTTSHEIENERGKSTAYTAFIPAELAHKDISTMEAEDFLRAREIFAADKSNGIKTECVMFTKVVGSHGKEDLIDIHSKAQLEAFKDFKNSLGIIMDETKGRPSETMGRVVQDLEGGFASKQSSKIKSFADMITQQRINRGDSQNQI